jgi:TonB family protein
MRAPNAPLTPRIRLHPDAAAVEVQALYRGVVIGARCLDGADAAPFLIGSDKGVDAPAAAHLLSGTAHPLVSLDERGFAVELTAQMTGTVIFEDHSAALQDLLRAHGPSFVPPPAARLQIACGDVAFLVSTTAPPQELPRPSRARLRDHWASLITGAGFLLFVLLLAMIPPDRRVLVGDHIAVTQRWIPGLNIPTVPPPAPPGAGMEPRGGGPAASGGDRTPPGPRRSAVRRPAGRPPGRAPADAGRTGVLGVLMASEGKSWASVFSSDDALVPGAFDDLLTDGDGTGRGPGFGPGPVGTGAAPQGGLAGSGPLGTIGSCDAACQSRIRGYERGLGYHLRRRIARAPSVIPVEAKVRGSLDKDIVRRTIRRHLNEVKYCYEQELLRKPELAGRITVQFTIAPTGSVMTSMIQASSLGNAAVETCVAQAVRRWEFPKPDGGGLVIVSYPFVLVPAGSS